jgi:hypothetical protein
MMYPTRDSLTADKPPTEWTYREWLQSVMALFMALSAKLQGSPLQLSYKGQEQVARGDNPFYELQPKEKP